jgi:hypothetical protein
LFTFIIVVMSTVMFERLSRVWSPLTPLVTVYITLAVALLLLLKLKMIYLVSIRKRNIPDLFTYLA